MANSPSSPSASAGPDSAARAPRERRTNARLRELIDEMLAGVRVAANRDFWTDDDRAAAAADLARIMDAVRAEAVAAPERRGEPG